jgi:hypothetical protein
MIKSVLVLAALTGQAEAIKVTEAGIFSKLIQEEDAAHALDNELKDAKERKKQQLIDAEAEYQKNVIEEEQEDKVRAEKEAEEMEERLKEEKHNNHNKLLAEAMNESLVQVGDNVEANSPMDMIGSGQPL